MPVEFDGLLSAKLNLYGKPWNADDFKQRPKARLKVVNNNPRFQVWINNGGANKGYTFNLDPVILATFLAALDHAARTPDVAPITLEIKSMFNANGERSKQMQPVSKITVGRDATGVVYLAFEIIGVGEPTAVFPFEANYFAEILENGEKISAVRGSELVALGWGKLISEMVAVHLIVRADVPPQRDPPAGQGNQGGGYQQRGGQGGGGGYQQQGNQGGGNNYQQPRQQQQAPQQGGAPYKDDDVPF